MQAGFQRLLLFAPITILLFYSCVYKLPELNKHPVAFIPVVRSIPPLSSNNQGVSYASSKNKAYVTTSWLDSSSDPPGFNCFTELYEIEGADNISSKRIYSAFKPTVPFHTAKLAVSGNDQIVVFLKDAAGDMGCWTEKRGIQFLYKSITESSFGFMLEKSLENGHFLCLFVDLPTYFLIDYVYDSGDFTILPLDLGANRYPLDEGIIPGYGYYALTYNAIDSGKIEYLTFRFGETGPTVLLVGSALNLTWGRVFSDSSNTPKIILYNSMYNLFSSSNKNAVWQSPKNIATLFSPDTYPAIQEGNQFHIVQAPLLQTDPYKFYSFEYDPKISIYSQDLSKDGRSLDANYFSGFFKLQYPSFASDFVIVHKDANTGPVTTHLLFYKDLN